MRPAALNRRARGWLLAVMIGIAVVAAGRCASKTAVVRMDADGGALEVLAGEWAGEYLGDEVDPRRGTILFSLIPGEDHAHGEVRMTPNGSRTPYARAERSRPTSGGGAGAEPPAWLTIRLVRARDGNITGELDPYWDPDRGCGARTTFRGTVSGQTMSGTFETIYDAPVARTHGRCRVVRLPSDGPRTPVLVPGINVG